LKEIIWIEFNMRRKKVRVEAVAAEVVVAQTERSCGVS
jgi:hypothetical protein